MRLVASSSRRVFIDGAETLWHVRHITPSSAEKIAAVNEQKYLPTLIQVRPVKRTAASDLCNSNGNSSGARCPLQTREIAATVPNPSLPGTITNVGYRRIG
jgi:hypothetical protein